MYVFFFYMSGAWLLVDIFFCCGQNLGSLSLMHYPSSHRNALLCPHPTVLLLILQYSGLGGQLCAFYLACFQVHHIFEFRASSLSNYFSSLQDLHWLVKWGFSCVDASLAVGCPLVPVLSWNRTFGDLSSAVSLVFQVPSSLNVLLRLIQLVILVLWVFILWILSHFNGPWHPVHSFV